MLFLISEIIFLGNIKINLGITILGCNTGVSPLLGLKNSIAQDLQNHYRFKETQAPDNFIWNNGEIASSVIYDDNGVQRERKGDVTGKFNTFVTTN